MGKPTEEEMIKAYKKAEENMGGVNGIIWVIDTLVNLGTVTALILMDVYTCAYFTSFVQRAQVFKRLILMAWLILMTCLVWEKPVFIHKKFPIVNNMTTKHLIFGLAYMLFVFVLFADPLLVPLSTGQTDLGDLKNYPFAVPIQPKSFYKGMIALNCTVGGSSVISIVSGLYVHMIGVVMKNNHVEGKTGKKA
ncbi:hypothetical protein GGI03_000278 [Coemansia sp. RSA 2337]|nr:hypothetical protein GGI08_004177 [Coemansia sp. S2]KAJ2071167.1 hypothetical protein GGH13_003537 [Coemansia sp. S155-1]KAJ2102706.1 hypothetical protein GGI09_001069 [Coemansia sp. S100]KAJ2110732.1 hypothetical protein GGI16_000169 [Coemansia sp. S142-1]KAJ2469578.1 hypothetical protein GGI03_000278 [Coemansia sp. RSA 2337]